MPLVGHTKQPPVLRAQKITSHDTMFLPSLIPAMRFVLPLDVLHRTMDGRSVSAGRMRSSLRPGPVEHFLTTGPPVRTTGHRRRRRSPPLNPPSPTRGDSPFSRSATPPEPFPPSPTPSTKEQANARRRSRRRRLPPPLTAAGDTLPRRTASCPRTPLSASASGLPQLPLHPPGSDPPPAARPHSIRVRHLRFLGI
jgi:hypothetical protein